MMKAGQQATPSRKGNVKTPSRRPGSRSARTMGTVEGHQRA